MDININEHCTKQLKTAFDAAAQLYPQKADVRDSALLATMQEAVFSLFNYVPYIAVLDIEHDFKIMLKALRPLKGTDMTDKNKMADALGAAIPQLNYKP